VGASGGTKGTRSPHYPTPTKPVEAASDNCAIYADLQLGERCSVVSEALLRTIGIGACLTVGAGLSAVFLGVLRRPHMMEIALATDPEQVKMIVQGGGQRVERLRRQLLADYAFIFCYWLTYVTIGVAIARSGGALYDILGLLAAFAASITALLDVVENVRTRGLLALTRPGDQVRKQPVAHLRRTSLAKWAASAVTLALLSALFLPGEGGVFALGLAFVALAVLGLVATRVPKLLSVYFGCVFLLGALLAVVLTGFPDAVLERL
jgi:hypothetical protein